ncbi:hypothetical protein [Alcanivorax sp. DP30]|uniref:hypothetical protein n=1 Tax=Alcanivorax sp. DP30 TaxID=2606217 RepID=UPI00136B901A|nr:hypothetical protein [Alcanivorax sp. DP30]MZR61836.1 hypothetical protein [Alcanivorax sp. DP30]
MSSVSNSMGRWCCNLSWRAALNFLAIFTISTNVSAMTSLSDEALSGVSGAGIAVALDDFRFAMAPTSYIELTGSDGGANWQRGDARYYGLSLTGGGSGTDWYGDGCASADPLSCPLGVGTISDFASVYNPFLLRVFQYEGYDYQGTYRNQIAPGSANSMPTVLELIGPSKVPDPWRWSFLGELEVGRNAGSPADVGSNHSEATFLQSQTIIYGKPITADGRPAILRLLKVENTADPTFGLMYQSALSGDFRFSVAHSTDGGPDGLHEVPNFDDNEGVHFKNVDAFLPLGQLHYQAITLDNVAPGDGNFVIELTRLPGNDANIYNDFYSFSSDCTGVYSGVDCGYKRTGRPERYNETHGYVYWGDPSSNNSDANTTDGIYFKAPAGETFQAYARTNNSAPEGNNSINYSMTGNAFNLGDARVEGLLVQHLKITSLGAN